MANMFKSDISDIRQLLQDVDMDLLHLRENIAVQFGYSAKCTRICDKVYEHITNASDSLDQLDRVIPSDYIDESSKLESRIKRLERLIK